MKSSLSIALAVLIISVTIVSHATTAEPNYAKYSNFKSKPNDHWLPNQLPRLAITDADHSVNAADLQKLSSPFSPYLVDIDVTKLPSSGSNQHAALLLEFQHVWQQSGLTMPPRFHAFRKPWILPKELLTGKFLVALQNENHLLEKLEPASASKLRKLRFTLWLRTFGISAFLVEELQMSWKFTETELERIAEAAELLANQMQSIHIRRIPILITDRLQEQLQTQGISPEELLIWQHFSNCYSILFLDSITTPEGDFSPNAAHTTNTYSPNILYVLADPRLADLTGVDPIMADELRSAILNIRRQGSQAFQVALASDSTKRQLTSIRQTELQQLTRLRQHALENTDSLRARIVQLAIRTHIFDARQLYRIPYLIEATFSDPTDQLALQLVLQDIIATTEADLHNHFLISTDKVISDVFPPARHSMFRAQLVDESLFSKGN